MKKLNLFYVFTFLCTAFAACSDVNEQVLDAQEQPVEQGGAILTKSFPLSTEWFNKQSLTLKSGRVVATPWSNSPVATNIPLYVRKDLDPKDGWVYVYSSLEETVGTDNYMIFYNRFTGILKGFYYLESGGQQNNGTWNIQFEGGTNKLLNGIDHFTIPLSTTNQAPSSVAVLTVNTIDTRGFEIGWNCFQTMLTYDNTYNLSSLRLKISPYNNNSATIRLAGVYQSSSSGSILSTNSSNGQFLSKMKDGAVSLIGDTGKDWIEKRVQDRNIPKVLSTAATGFVPAVVSAGVNLIFGSFIGKSKPTVTESKLEFTTKGEMTITGDLNMMTSGLIPPITNVRLDTEERLGAWNIQQQPTVRFDTKAYIIMLGNPPSRPHSYYRYFKIDNVNAVINPKIISEASRYTVTTELAYYGKFNGVENWNNSSGSQSVQYISHQLIYKDTKNEIYAPLKTFTIQSNQEPKKDPSNPYGKGYLDLTYEHHLQLENKYVVKVTVTIYPKAPYYTDPIVSTKTFLPIFRIENLNLY